MSKFANATKKPKTGAGRSASEHALLARFLREIREHAGVSQQQVADHLGVTQTWVYHREAGVHRIALIDFIHWCDACQADTVAEVRRFTQSLT